MVTMHGGNAWSQDTNDYYGLADDTKPTAGVSNGSRYFEMDTGTLYFYDEEHAEWLPWTEG